MTLPALPARAWLPVLVVPLFLLSGPAQASPDLNWSETSLAVEAAPLAEKVEADFRFTNSTDHPVTISDVQSTCGCTVAELDQKTYAPRESGRLRAVFTIGDRIGRQEKKITVRTAGPKGTETILSLQVTIPILYELTPLFVSWDAGEPPAPKSIRLHILRPDIIHPTSVESGQSEPFRATLEPVPGQGDAYSIKITPGMTNQSVNGSFALNLVTQDGKNRTANFYAVIRAAINKPRP